MKAAKVKVNLRKQTVWIGKTVYWYERRNDRHIWYRNSRTYADVGDEKLLIKEAEEAVSRGEIANDEWSPVERRIKDKDKLKQLEKILFRALKEEVRRRRHKRKQHEKNVANQNVAPPQQDVPKQESGRQKRTKWGVRIHSSDGIHFFNLGCWKSTKYPGKVSVRIGRYLYTISQNDLNAMIAELQRGLQPEIPQEPI
jgi:hypothetical protein